MLLTRRQFLLSVPVGVAGYILPSFLTQITIPLQSAASYTLYAESQGDGQFQLYLGNPYEEPPAKTWREYIEEDYGDLETYVDLNGYEPGEFDEDLDSTVDQELYFESWAHCESSNARAYYLLENLELGTELEESIIFINGCCPGNDYIGVIAKNVYSLSLLQQRFNALNEEIKIEIYKQPPV